MKDLTPLLILAGAYLLFMQQQRNGNGNGTSNSSQSTVKAKITIPDDPSKITISQEGSSGAACNSHGDCTTTGEICLPTGKCGYGFL